MRLVLIFVMALSIHSLSSQETKVPAKQVSLVERMRPTLMNIIGEEWTVKIIGEAPVVKPVEPTIALPAIPALVQDAKSTAVYDKKPDTVVLKPEVEEKYIYGYIKEVYESTRQQKPNDDEIAKMGNALSQGATREGIYRMLVLDSVYGGMENYDKPIKSNAADFAVYFYEKYLGKKVSKENLKGLNIFTVKRLVTEKALDVIDAYGDNRDNIEKWYAVMSADLAAKFPQIWTVKIRKDTSAVHHKAWATKVPLQHIKSETIIKIHQAFNSLM